jgi:hypothetical protein
MRFSREQFPYVWVFQSFGGFGEDHAVEHAGDHVENRSTDANGHYVMVLEPCTTKPYDLAAAWRAGTTPVLHPIESKSYAMEISIDPDVGLGK